jgi:polar amino acid transport system substrate-binding protein
LKIGVQAGTTGYYTALDILGLKDGDKSDRLVYYNDFGLSVQALLTGDIDAVISDVAAGRGYIGANAGKLKLLDENLSSDSLGFMFPQGSDLVKPVNAALAAMKYDGYLAYLQNKWFFLFNPGPDAAGNPQLTVTAAATAASK